jgi:glutathione-regulated potassium-efflux system protein KefB
MHNATADVGGWIAGAGREPQGTELPGNRTEEKEVSGMPEVTLIEAAALLAALAIAAPLARVLGIGSVLGYLMAGVLLGPFGVRFLFTSSDASQILHFAEFGIVLLLFLIGLELRPLRLWSMRTAFFGLGGAQVAATSLALCAAGMTLGLAWQSALFVGLALALSSTAFALQVLEENGELSARHGRLAFAVLLFQDLAAIPLIALAPFFAAEPGASGGSLGYLAALKALATIAGVAVAGYFLLDVVIRLIALTRVKEAMTAAALLTVVGFAILMQQAGVSAALGAFIAGALLAESSYRHELEADIQPFEGLLLGLFFTAIGMTLNLRLLVEQPWLVLALAAGLVLVKAAVLGLLGRWQGLEGRAARRLGLVLSQGGEFAFVLLAAGAATAVISRREADILGVVVTLSMAATPLLMLLDGAMTRLFSQPSPAYETPPANDGHVIIAGFGRYGQIVARVLRGKGIPFTALDINAEQVETVKKFGSEAFYGDVSRPEILEAAGADRARALVLAIDDAEAALRTAEMVTGRWPRLPLYVRARNRNHAHRLLDLGVRNLQRETFHSALETTRQLLKGCGHSERAAEQTIRTFRLHDERRLSEDYKHYTDTEKMQEKARGDAATLEKLFAEDALEEARLAAAQPAETKERVR